jgi:tRNA-dihydrouridine synthase A
MPPLSVAPMMDRTDRHFRYFLRLLTRHTLLYTEMVTMQAVLRGDRARHLDFDPSEHPIALQLGGDDPQALAECARIAVDWGYDEVNLNVGCPSDRVQKGSFGVCLMKRPERVAECVAAMQAVVDVPVTVKHRIGVDDLDAYEDMLHFVDRVAEAGCVRFTVHARKAWLKGLSPKQNRNVPPLRYADVHRLKTERPHLEIEINGGIRDLDVTQDQLAHVDAVMIGRAAYDDPWLFSAADARIFGAPAQTLSRHDAARAMIDYAAQRQAAGDRVHHVVRHLHGLFQGVPGARKWRQGLNAATRPGASPAVIEAALAAVPELG